MSEAGVFSLHALGFCDQLTCLPSLEADVFFLVGGCCAKVCRNRRGGEKRQKINLQSLDVNYTNRKRKKEKVGDEKEGEEEL